MMMIRNGVSMECLCCMIGGTAVSLAEVRKLAILVEELYVGSVDASIPVSSFARIISRIASIYSLYWTLMKLQVLWAGVA